MRVIDRDRVEEHNVSTQLYGVSDVGTSKVDVLRSRLYRSVGVEIDVVAKDLNERNVRSLLKDASLVVDTFDNSASRGIVTSFCATNEIPCLHVGLFADYGEVVWNDDYRVPVDMDEDTCDYPLARNLILLTVAVASETLLRYALDVSRLNWSITFSDFSVRPLFAHR